MKLPLLLCALFLSIHGWCAIVAPFHYTARAATPIHQNIKNVKSPDMASGSLLLDKMKIAMIAWALVVYLAAVIWWTITAKQSLDRILDDVLRGMAQ